MYTTKECWGQRNVHCCQGALISEYHTVLNRGFHSTVKLHVRRKSECYFSTEEVFLFLNDLVCNLKSFLVLPIINCICIGRMRATVQKAIHISTLSSLVPRLSFACD